MALLIAFILAPLNIILNGYVFQTLWNWFIVPFVGFHSIPIVGAIGISLLIAFVTHQYSPVNNAGKDAKTILLEAFSYMFSKPLGALFVGWIVTLFM